MFTRPTSLSDAAIVTAVADHWGHAVDHAEYAPVGFGSHHWLAGNAGTPELFVTVDDLSAKTRSPQEPLGRPFQRLDAAFATARALADDGHDFVVAPEPTRDGRVLHRLDERYTMACFPYIDGLAGSFGEYRSATDRDAVARHLVVLHELDPAAAPRCLIEDFELPNRQELLDALRSRDEPWSGGPYAEPARVLLRENADDVARLLGRYDDLLGEVLETRSEWRLTHGEPHGSNVLTTHGESRLIDWDTALIAPRERDAWLLDPDNAEVARLYADAGGRDLGAGRLDMYRIRWDLSEIAGYVSLFRAEHDDTEDARESLRNLTHHVRQPRR